MTRCALYCRVSTSDQESAMQLSELRDYVKLRKWDFAGEFVDEDVSGATRERPQLDKLLDKVKRGGIDVVLVWRFDRMARSVAHMIEILEYLNKHGVDFCSMQENVDTQTATGKLLFIIIAAFAEFERQVIRDRTRAGMAEAKRQGKPIGRPAAVIDAGLLQRTIEEAGSVRKAARILGISPSTCAAKWKAIQHQRSEQDNSQVQLEVTTT